MIGKAGILQKIFHRNLSFSHSFIGHIFQAPIHESDETASLSKACETLGIGRETKVCGKL